MKLNIVPEKVIPARFEVVFHEDRQTESFLASEEPYETRLREDIVAWLDAHAPGWSASFDRGDFGEGAAHVTISLPSETAARAFHAQWNEGLCTTESAGPHCPQMARVSFDRFECATCGVSLTAMNPRVLPPWTDTGASSEP